MMAVVVGGTDLAVQVAQALYESGDDVTIIEREIQCPVSEAAAGPRRVFGDATAAATLETAGANRADVVVACTRSDEDNLVISLLSKRRFDVPRVIARVNDLENSWLFDETWGVDRVVSPADSLVNLIKEATASGHTVRLADLAAVSLVLVEATVTASSVARRHLVSELALAPGDLVAAVVRDGRSLPAADAHQLRAGDRVLVLTDPGGEGRVHHAFSPDEPAHPVAGEGSARRGQRAADDSGSTRADVGK